MKKLLIGIICMFIMGCSNEKSIYTTKIYNNISNFNLIYSGGRNHLCYINFNNIQTEIDLDLFVELKKVYDFNKSINKQTNINIALDVSVNKVICVEVNN